MCELVCVCVYVCVRERERKRERKRERDRQTDRQAGRQTDTDRGREGGGTRDRERFVFWEEYVCLSVSLSRHHAHISAYIDLNFTHNFMPSPGRFLHALRLMLPFLISEVTLELIQATLPLFQLFTLICLPYSRGVVLSCLRCTVCECR